MVLLVVTGACSTSHSDDVDARGGESTRGSITFSSNPPGPESSTGDPAGTDPTPTTAPTPTDGGDAAGQAGTASQQATSLGTVLVIGIVDGDTIDVDTGERVRLIGVDTPERGRCGAAEATAATMALVANKDVVLTPGTRDDRDRYGRLLRYVDVDGVDVGMELLRKHLAVARYDSRDGYGRHDREAAYVAASAPEVAGCSPPTGSDTSAATPAAPTSVAGPTAAPGSPPRFATCKEATAAGLGPYRRGLDQEYGWYRDADGDGLVCER